MRLSERGSPWWRDGNAFSEERTRSSSGARSEAPEEIIEQIVAGAVADVEVEPDRARAIAQAIELAGEGDVVLIAGKGAEQGQEFADRTVPFDDRETAREALRKLGART